MQVKEFVSWLLFPPRCPACGVVLDMDKSGFCVKCGKQVVRVKEPVCFCCGREVRDERKEYCAACGKARHSFLQNKATFLYVGAGKRAMYRFKYNKVREVGTLFAREMVAMHGEWIRMRRVEAIVPIPAHPKKERERGFNQAQALAESLSSQLKRELGLSIPVVKVAKRTRETVPQKGLSVFVRRKNLKRAFKIDENVVQSNGMYSASRKPLYGSVLLVDDIFTTGATLDAVSELMLEEGVAKKVYCITAMATPNV